MMKYIKYIFITVLFLLILSIITIYMLRWNTMSIISIKKKWGNDTFYVDTFKKGNYQIRASMVANLLQRKNEFKQLTVIDIKKQFGPPDGYFISETIPAYIIETNGDTWQLVFQFNNDRVSDLFVHKSCCYSHWQTILMNFAFQMIYYGLTPILKL